MQLNALPSELLAFVGNVDPGANSTTGGDSASAVYSTDAVDMSDFERAAFTLLAGTLGSSATLAFKLQESITGNSAWVDIVGKAITTFTQTPTNRSDEQASINIRREELTEGYRYVKAIATIASATSDFGVEVLADKPRYGQASDDDLAAVDEIIA